MLKLKLVVLFKLILLKLGDVMLFLLVFALVSLDLFSKIIVKLFFMDVTFSMFNGAVKFMPFLNTHSMSLFNGLLFNLNLSLSNLVILNLIVLTLMIPIYLYLKSIEFKNMFLNMVLVLLIAGSISSTIDRLLWGGSLDFIVIFNHVIDFKDIYLFSSIIIFIFYMFKCVFYRLFRVGKSYRL